MGLAVEVAIGGITGCGSSGQPVATVAKGTYTFTVVATGTAGSQTEDKTGKGSGMKTGMKAGTQTGTANGDDSDVGGGVRRRCRNWAQRISQQWGRLRGRRGRLVEVKSGRVKSGRVRRIKSGQGIEAGWVEYEGRWRAERAREEAEAKYIAKEPREITQKRDGLEGAWRRDWRCEGNGGGRGAAGAMAAAGVTAGRGTAGRASSGSTKRGDTCRR